MIEVMVASTLMIIVVMMLGMMFNQTSQVWRTGKQRVDMFKGVRSLFGPFQRDASAAVDQKTIPKGILDEWKLGRNQNFSGNEIAFFTLTGTGMKKNTEIPKRAFSFVTYNGGTRTEQWIGDASIYSQTLTEDPCIFKAYKVESSGNVSDYSADPDSKGVPMFPAFISVRMQATSDSLAKAYDVGAASAGPDRMFGLGPGDLKGKDDIRTWVE